jgi:hypothetical protein
MSTPEDELTPAIREALAALPREREPGRMLEERTVRALRGQGLLEAPQRGAARVRFPAAWIVGAAAACLALFTSGIAVGQWMGERRVITVLSQAPNAQQAALQVQQTGSAYVASLAQLQQVSDSASPAQKELARQVAVQALRAAANELVRMAPDDPVASGILSGFDQAETARTRPDSASRKPEVIWY